MLSAKEQEQATVTTYFQRYLAVLVKAIRQGKEKGI